MPQNCYIFFTISKKTEAKASVFYSRFIRNSVSRTAAELATATTMRLLPRYARTTATISAAAPLIMEAVLLRIAGKVMAVKQA